MRMYTCIHSPYMIPRAWELNGSSQAYMPGLFDEDDDMDFDEMCELEAEVLPEMLPEYSGSGAFRSTPREEEESVDDTVLPLDWSIYHPHLPALLV